MPRKKKAQSIDETKSAECAGEGLAPQASVSDTPGIEQPIEDVVARIRELEAGCQECEAEFTELKSASSQSKAKLDAAVARLRGYARGLSVTMPLFAEPNAGPLLFAWDKVFPSRFDDQASNSLPRQTHLDKLMGPKLADAVLEGCGAGTLGDLYDCMLSQNLNLVDITGSPAQAEAVKRALGIYFASQVAVKVTA